MENIKNKVIEIEDYYGNTIMYFEIDKEGNITTFGDCEIADIDDDYILETNKELVRIQSTITDKEENDYELWKSKMYY